MFFSFWLKPGGRENEGLRKIGNRRLRTLRVFFCIAYSSTLLWAVFHGQEDKAAVCLSFFGFCTNLSEMSIEIWYSEVRLRDPTGPRGSRGCLVILCWYKGSSLDREQNREYAEWKEKYERYYETVQDRRKRWNFDEPSARTSARTPGNFNLYLLYIYIYTPMYTYNLYLLYVPIALHCSRLLLSWYLIPFLIRDFTEDRAARIIRNRTRQVYIIVLKLADILIPRFYCKIIKRGVTCHLLIIFSHTLLHLTNIANEYIKSDYDRYVTYLFHYLKHVYYG